MLVNTPGPYVVNWNYTYRCNLRCSHCYSRAPTYPEELSEEAYRRIVAEIISLNVFTVSLGGGESVMRPDHTTTISSLSRVGVFTNLISNGSYIDRLCAATLRNAGVGCLALSLDGLTADYHDRFRNRPGSFDMVMSAIENAVAAGIDVRLSVTLTRATASTPAEFVTFALERGVSKVHFKLFRPAGYGLINRARYELTEAQITALAFEVAELRPRMGDVASLASASDGNPCACGRTQITLRPNGDIALCAYDEAVFGSLRYETLAEVWTRVKQGRGTRRGCTSMQPHPWPSNPGATVRRKHLEVVR